MKKLDKEITDEYVSYFFVKFSLAFFVCFSIFVIGNIIIQKYKIDLAKNNIYAYCTNIYKDFETHGNLIEFVDHCMIKNK